jgi:hypothetical protein
VGVYNVYSKSVVSGGFGIPTLILLWPRNIGAHLEGDLLDLVTTGVIATSDREAIMLSQSASGRYMAIDQNLPEATIEALITAQGWPHQNGVEHELIAESVISGVISPGSRVIQSISNTSGIREGQVVTGIGIGLARVQVVLSNSVILDDQADTSGTHFYTFKEMLR